MLPLDMLLNPLNQVIEGYNDKIIVNTSGLKLGRHVEKPLAKHKVKLRKILYTLDDGHLFLQSGR